MPEPDLNSIRDQQAIRQALTDQTIMGVRDTAKLLAAFRQELLDNHCTTTLAEQLTADYFNALLDAATPEEPE